MHLKLKILKFKTYILAGITIAVIALFIWIIGNSFVVVNIKPAGAMVTIDNVLLKTNRFGTGRKTMKAGTYLVKVEADGYMGFGELKTFRRGLVTKINVDLKELPEPSKIGNGNLIEKQDDNNFLYLDSSGSKIYKSTVAIKDEKEIVIETRVVTNSHLSGIKEIVWSPNKQLALFRKDDGIFLFDFQKYDFVSQKESFWGKDISGMAWSPDNSKIAYYYNPPGGEKTLIFSDIANTIQNRILNLAELGINDPVLKWSNNSQWLLIIPRNKDYNTNKIYLFNTYNKTIKEITEIGNQVDAVFSLDDKEILYATYSKDTVNPISLLISKMDMSGENQESLEIRSILSKTAWRNEKNLVAVVYDQNEGQRKIINFNIEDKQSFAIQPKNADIKSVESLISLNEGRIIVYQNDQGLYALRVD